MGFQFFPATSTWAISICRLGKLKQHESELVPQPTAGYHAGPSLKAPGAPRFCDSSAQGWGDLEGEQGAFKALPRLRQLTTNPGILLTPSQFITLFRAYAYCRPHIRLANNFDGVPLQTVDNLGLDAWLQIPALLCFCGPWKREGGRGWDAEG